jgi:hypothetical protein
MEDKIRLLEEQNEFLKEKIKQKAPSDWSLFSLRLNKDLMRYLKAQILIWTF